MKFKPEDFLVGIMPEVTAKFVCEIANAKLQEWLDQAPTVFAWKEYGLPNRWKARQKDTVKPGQATHTAKLVCCEILKTEDEK